MFGNINYRVRMGWNDGKWYVIRQKCIRLKTPSVGNEPTHSRADWLCMDPTLDPSGTWIRHHQNMQNILLMLRVHCLAWSRGMAYFMSGMECTTPQNNKELHVSKAYYLALQLVMLIYGFFTSSTLSPPPQERCRVRVPKTSCFGSRPPPVPLA